MAQQEQNEQGLVIVGGGPGGLEAARAYREAGGSGPVTIVSADTEAPYNRPPLSKDYLRGESEASELPLEDESFFADHDIDLRLGVRVDELDTTAYVVRLDTGATLAYRACVLATGGDPAALPVPGGDDERVHYLRSRADADGLVEAAKEARTAIVVGSGFIGCEAAVSLATRGLSVTMLSQESRPQLERLGPDAADHLQTWLTDEDIAVVGDVEVTAIEEGRTVVLADGSTWSADLVLVAAGVEQHSELAEAAGITCRDGRIVTDASMRTDVAGVFAVGDVAFAHNATAGRPLAVEHWEEAVRMGEIAGKVAAGRSDEWATAPGFWSDIGEHTLKYAAWGDGFDDTRHDGSSDGFTVWYARDGVVVGVLTHNRDDDYERGQELVEKGEAFSRI